MRMMHIMHMLSTTRMIRMIRAMPAPLLGVAGLALLVLVWHLVTAGGLVPKAYLASPAATGFALLMGLCEGDLSGQLAATTVHMLHGWLLASALGIALGALIGISESASVHLRPLLAFARALPASAVIPVAISIAGLTPAMVLGVIAFGSVWPTLTAAVQGFATLEPRLRDVARLLNLSRTAVIWKIGLPNALPDIAVGMRLSLTIALILSVIGEMLAGQEGLGTAILLAARAFRAPDLYAGIVLLGVIGLAGSQALLILERRHARWRT
jgi:sulfonate transport system permease protein